MNVARSGATADHWCVRIARQAGWANADKLSIPAGMPAADAWAAVTSACGVTEEALAEEIARGYRLQVVRWGSLEIPAERLVPEGLARRHLVFPVREDYGTLYLATIDPNDLSAQQEVALASGRTPVLLVGTPSGVRSAIDAGYSVESPSGARRRAAAVTSGLAGAPATGSRPRIILVDDDAVIRALANVLLSKEGFDVTEVADGEAAMEKLMIGPEFTLMVLDLGLPKLAGRDVLMRVRSDRELQRLPIVILTGSADESLEAALLDAGADDYLRKPIDPARFVARVKAVVRRSEQG